MKTPSPETRQIQWMLTGLVILGILILALVMLLLAYPRAFAPQIATPAPTVTLRPTFSPSPSPTQTLTPVPTFTPRATHTPTGTPTPALTVTPTLTLTPVGPPTLTPARPIVGEGIYSLIPWTPEKAEEMVAYFNYYPYSLSESARGPDGAGFYQAFQYALQAQREALLQFPNAPQADAWRWGAAYNLARLADPQAGEAYADLLTRGLNGLETTLPELAGWFQQKEPRLELAVIPLDPPTGFTTSTLVEVRGEGSAFIWLVESPSAFQSAVLDSRFDFVAPREGGVVIADFTGDGHDEAAVFYQNLPQDFVIAPPRVFSLAAFPPRELDFAPSQARYDLGTEFRSYWLPEGLDLAFRTTVFPACPVTVERKYHWDGERFEFVSDQFTVEPGAALLSLCKLTVEHASQSWGPGPTVSLMQALLPDWPPATDERGETMPLDAMDEWQYRLAIAHALTGNAEAARRNLDLTINHPSILNSRWVAPARDFLAAYQKPEDVYRACLQVTECRAADAFRYLIGTVSLAEFPQVGEILAAAGVQPRASGFFDFEQDGESERWMVLRHRPLEKLEFWILTTSRSDVFALLIDPDLASNDSRPEYLNIEWFPFAAQKPPIVLLDNETALTLHRDPQTQAPYVLPAQIPKLWPNRYLLAFEPIEAGLWQGEDPAQITQDLIQLETEPGLLCKGNWSCDRYYYLLGLAQELAGDKLGALEAYMRLWWDYSRSPYTAMARMKIAGKAVLPSATPSPTITPTGAPTATPTVTGTPPTPTPSRTLAPTFTPTTGPYP